MALHDERVEEEKQGHVRWLRPEYQVPRFGKEIEAEPEVVLPRRDGARAAGEAPRPWPQRLVEQLGALQELLAAAPVTPEGAAERFEGAGVQQVRERLETLAGAGEVWVDGEGRYNLVEQGV